MIASDPRIALTPTIRGVALEMSPPKTNRSKIKVSGIEIPSANAKSFEILSLSPELNVATPPT